MAIYSNQSSKNDYLSRLAGGTTQYSIPTSQYTSGLNSGAYAPQQAPLHEFGGMELFNPEAYYQAEGSSKASSYGGLPAEWRDKIVSGVSPNMIRWANLLPRTIENYTKDAARMYANQGSRAMDSAARDILEGLAGRGMVSSSVAGDAIGKGLSDITQTYADKTYQARYDSAKMRAAVPSILSQIAGLGRYSSSSSESTNSAADPGQPYATLSSFLMGY